MWLKKYQKIILLSHMRSRSSVLSHILGSHAEVAGYYEQHQRHADSFFEIKVKANLLLDNNLSSQHRYLYDKVLHERFDPKSLKGYKVIVLIRKPSSALKSIMSMGDITKSLWRNDPYRAFAYYCQRLQNIIDIVEKNNMDVCFVEADDLVEKTDDVLNGLSVFLELDSPLTSNYKSFGKTGEAIYGDPSDNIKSGTIVKTENHTKVMIPDELLAIAQHYYDRCQKLCAKK
ncbi:hypothetical protein WNY58_00875 [Neptuniibacter pectenicola]|uniref:Sulfotransferase family protein n=1 Tax=Neptuniibacter pectenicola TaxID=1806669 RepID=A0ABU9TNG2_9GAMM